MDRQKLIQKLVEEAKPVRPLASIGARFAWVALVGLLCLLVGLHFFGIRRDLQEELIHLPFWIETASLLVLVAWAAWDALRLSVPGGYPSPRYLWLPVVAIGVWIITCVVRFLFLSGNISWAFDRHFACALCILALASIPGVFIFTLLVRAYPLKKRTAGMLAGLSAGAVGALGMQIACAHDQLPHILLWHVMPLLLCAALGSLLVFERNERI